MQGVDDGCFVAGVGVEVQGEGGEFPSRVEVSGASLLWKGEGDDNQFILGNWCS